MREHFADGVTIEGEELLARPVRNDEAIVQLTDDGGWRGQIAVVVDMTASGAQLLLSTAARRSVPVAYVTGLQMRRAAQLYAGSTETDPRDAWVLADCACRHTDQLVWLDVSDELLTRLRLLNGRDVDLGATRRGLGTDAVTGWLLYLPHWNGLWGRGSTRAVFVTSSRSGRHPQHPARRARAGYATRSRNDHHDSQTKSPPRDGRHLMPRS
jgi:hypothetical protein